MDEKTPYLKLPLPAQEHLLEGDLKRLRQAFQLLDASALNQNSELIQESIARAEAITEFSESISADITEQLSGITNTLEGVIFPCVVVSYSGPFHTDKVSPIHKTTGKILANWKLCNGENDTPDLRGKFIRGGDTTNIGELGGEETHIHGVTGSISSVAAGGTVANTTPGNVGVTTLGWNEMPYHIHQGYWYASGNELTGFVVNATANRPIQSTYTQAAGSSWGHTHTSPAHTHAFTGIAHTHTLSNAKTDTQSNLPPYYTLCYIMKVA